MEHVSLAQRKGTSDAALVMEARNGQVHSLGLLFERHRPQLYAAAVSLLGYTSNAEDAVHDTFLTALARLDQLREPAAVGGWLHAILRNCCLIERRQRRPQIGGAQAEQHFRDMPDDERIETGIETRELRDWVWAALRKLPEEHRATVMLRYFSFYNSYEEVSTILGVPVGTVRSRLFDAKIRLSELLLSAAGDRDETHEQLQAERRSFYEDAFRTLYCGQRDKFLSHFSDDLQLIWSTTGNRFRGREHFDAEMDSDLQTGVRVQPKRIMASDNITVLEAAIANPPETPYLCPPGVVMVMKEGAAQVERLYLHMAARPPFPMD
ncbi:RNA polymerase sigma factor [Mesorhizobium sp. CA8]|uniref:RNA polymerase sigma factor n=1 Tax=unclassified Mesorhizobium TaxID=325217 RepID=UPI001CCCDAE7|nr:MULTISPECIES: RNA polymerase sigma factor [unclassified Mesorhizobium]MBZ9761923.1 RNA polymerase sigma factor [Mesorhizobium sp. CA8]MBZ9821827.1 RNA polymerase sigma factor [Mesorhizobium sp. CA4]